jgi:acetyl-CoA C-acetyltransferase
MGSFAQETADAEGITREEMDAFAIESVRRAKGRDRRRLPGGGDRAGHGRDTQAATPWSATTSSRTSPISDKIPNLRPAFAKDGTITAANASPSPTAAAPCC